MDGSSTDNSSVDLGIVTHTCICGSALWKVLASFEDYELATYSLEMYCVECNSKARTPTPLDHPDYDG